MEVDISYMIIGALVTGLLVFALLAFIYFYQKRVTDKQLEKRAVEDLLREEELKSAYALLEGQEKERQRIAEDLHDHVGGLMFTIGNYAELLSYGEASEDDKRLLTKLQDATQQAIVQVRRVSHELDHSSFGPVRFEEAVTQHAESLTSAKGIAVDCTVNVKNIEYRPLLKDMYLLIQELLTNTIKHAGANEIHLDVNGFEHNELSIIYSDNGKGFDTTQSADGIGMKNIRSRVDKYKGTVEVESAPGSGTSFIIAIPPQL